MNEEYTDYYIKKIEEALEKGEVELFIENQLYTMSIKEKEMKYIIDTAG